MEESGLSFLSVIINGCERKLLIDNGATVSVLKSYCLLAERVDARNKTRITGVCGSMTSQGSATVEFLVGSERVAHRFIILEHLETQLDGILGVDFLKSRFACIDYFHRFFSFSNNNHLIKISLTGRVNTCISIPARCEQVVFCNVTETDECVIENEMISEGVLTASTIVRPQNGKVPVRILNTRDERVELINFVPNTHKLRNYELRGLAEPKLTSEKARKIIDVIELKHLRGEEFDSVYRICLKYFDVFHDKDEPLGVTNLYREKIALAPGAQPSYKKPYRLPHAQKELIQKEIKEMLANDIIEPAKSPWSSPLLIVPKKADASGQKKWRVVIDYRELNEKIIGDKFPLPNITEILDSLSGAILFSHLDLSSGYYQVELEDESRPCTSFVTDQGQWQLKRLPMGLKISPSAFSRVMTVAMSGLSPEACFVYLDDIIVHGRNLQEHNRNLVAVLEKLRKVNLKLNPSKCEFLKRSLVYLGHSISEEGVRPDEGKIEAITKWPTPGNANELVRFIATANYYRRFIRNFAGMTVPLNRLLKKGATFSWDESCEQAFKEIKLALSSPPVLQFPDFSAEGRFILRTDASRMA